VEFDVYQCNNGETVKASGTLQSLSIPPTVWSDISMDFIVGLPKSSNKLVIIMVVNHISRYAHLCSLQHPFTASIVDQHFMGHIFKLHVMPRSIFSDRDSTFTNIFLQELFKLQGTQFHLSTTYHPNTNVKTEVVNKCLETYMSFFASERKNRKNQWAQWLPLVKWWYNTSYHIDTRMNHFEALYGQNIPSFLLDMLTS
jgi:hypothetical protein